MSQPLEQSCAADGNKRYPEFPESSRAAHRGRLSRLWDLGIHQNGWRVTRPEEARQALYSRVTTDAAAAHRLIHNSIPPHPTEAVGIHLAAESSSLWLPSTSGRQGFSSRLQTGLSGAFMWEKETISHVGDSTKLPAVRARSHCDQPLHRASLSAPPVTERRFRGDAVFWIFYTYLHLQSSTNMEGRRLVT